MKKRMKRMWIVNVFANNHRHREPGDLVHQAIFTTRRKAEDYKIGYVREYHCDQEESSRKKILKRFSWDNHTWGYEIKCVRVDKKFRKFTMANSYSW